MPALPPITTTAWPSRSCGCPVSEAAAGPDMVPPGDGGRAPTGGSDHSGMRVVDHHLTRPRSFQNARVAPVQGGDVLTDRIDLTCGPDLPARHLHGADEVRKPRHLAAHAHMSAGCLHRVSG